MKTAIKLMETERVELTKRAVSRTGRAEDARRARLILLLEQGHTWAEIRGKLACNDGLLLEQTF